MMEKLHPDPLVCRAFGPAHELLQTAFGVLAVGGRLLHNDESPFFELYLSAQSRHPLLHNPEAMQNFFQECGVKANWVALEENDHTRIAFLLRADQLRDRLAAVHRALEKSGLPVGAEPTTPTPSVHEVIRVDFPTGQIKSWSVRK